MSHEPAPPPANRTGAVAATPGRRRRPAWLIPLLALLGLLALALLALALYALLHHSAKKSVPASVAAASPTGASTPSGLPASPSSGTASGGAVPGGGSGSAPASAGSGAAGGGSGAGLPAAGSGTGSAAGGAALVGGGGVAAKAATGIEAGTAAGGSAAKGAGSAAAGTAQGTVLFASDSAALDPGARQVLTAAAARIKAQHPSKVTVTGYTDVVGGQPSNVGLSLQRAEAVAAVLRTELGSTPPVTAAAKGQADPVASNDTADGRQQNRRASITTS